MSRRGRRARGIEVWVERFEAIADAHTRGLGTGATQIELGVRREVVVRVRRVLRAAEERGMAKAVETAASPERAPCPFPKYPALRDLVLARIVRARDALADGDLELAAAALAEVEVDLGAVVDLERGVHPRISEAGAR